MQVISYTAPCHKRIDDLCQSWPAAVSAAGFDPDTEIIFVDYGNDLPIVSEGFVKIVRVEADYFHMAHARNVGIKAATGDIIVAFLADQILAPGFFKGLRDTLQPGTFLTWQETFVFWREDILAAGGFDERFEFYGPEGKELSDRLQRRGLRPVPIPKHLVSQIPTPDAEKVKHYRLPFSKRHMHELGMATWRENRANNLLVANACKDWGAATCLTSA